MADKFQNKYRIPSARLPSWDYGSNGAYFITICTAEREHFFGEIIDNKMQLSEIGKKVNDNWLEIPKHFPFVILDEFVVMPNHVHGIIIINKTVNVGADNAGGNVSGNARGNDVVDGAAGVETGHTLSLQPPSLQSDQSTQPNQTKKYHPRFRNQGKNTISAMTGSFKSAVTKWCNDNNFPFGWQSRFHDHIIRDKDELGRIRNI